MRTQMVPAALLIASSGALAAAIPTRTTTGTFPIDPAKVVTRVETTRVDFLPGQEMPEHMHPVPVVCFVAKGSFLVSMGTQPVRKVSIGDSTLERAGEVVHYFRDIAAAGPGQLYCAILAGTNDKQLSIMLSK